MKTCVIMVAALLASLMAPATLGQVIINEVHGFGAGAGLSGDYLELWNQGSTPVDLSGWSITVWNSDAGTSGLVTQVIPNTGSPGRHLIPPGCLWVFQEGPAELGQPLDGSFAGLRGMKGLPTSWVSSSSIGCRVDGLGGVCSDYVYLRRGTTAPPAVAPNLGSCVWTLGNVGSTGSGFGHLFRLTNTNTNSFADWAQDATANPGSPGFPNTTGGAAQVPLAATPWETNSPACNLDIDGVQNDGYAPIDVTRCVTQVITINIQSTLLGQGWEMGVNRIPGRAGPSCLGPGNGGGLTPGGQVANLNLGDPATAYLNDLTYPPFPGNMALVLNGSPPISLVSAQMLIFDPAHLDGFQLSAHCQLHVGWIYGVKAGPTGDDSAVAVPVGCLPFYGVSYPEMYVTSNGRITFGTADTGAAPDTVTEFLTDPPCVGQWADFDPSQGGSITITTPADNVFRVDYLGVPYFGESSLVTSTFSVEFYTYLGWVVIDGVTGVAPHPAAVPNAGDNGWLGLSAGQGMATDPGPVAFTVGGPNYPLSSTDAIYNWGLSGTLGGGVTDLFFVPQGGSLSPNYSWTGI